MPARLSPGEAAPFSIRAPDRTIRAMRQRTALWLAWSVWAFSMVALLVPFAYRLTGHRVAGFGDTPGSLAPFVTVLLFILSVATVGAVVAPQRPSYPVGRRLLGLGPCR